MRKLFILVFAIFIAGCSGGKGKSDYEGPYISDYFPVHKNTSMFYESPTLPALNQMMFISYTDGGKFQRVILFNEIAQTEVFENKNGELRLINSEQQVYAPEKMTANEPRLDILVLKEPLVVGATWDSSNGAASEITAMDVPVRVPYGEFEAMEVATVDKQGRGNVMYYAKGVGLIKVVYVDPNSGRDYTAELSEVRENVGLNLGFGVYDIDDEGIDFSVTNKSISFPTDGDMLAFLNEAVKLVDGEGILDGEIKSITTDRDAESMTVDLSRGFSGSSTKEGVLNCLAQTIGRFYEIKNVSFTENGKKTGNAEVYYAY